MLPILKEFDVIPINFLWEDPERLIQLFKIMNEQDEERFWEYARKPLDLKSIYFPAPYRGGAHLPKFVIWQPKNMSYGSAFVSNYEDGMVQLMRHLNRRFHIRYFSAYLCKNHVLQGKCSFEHRDENGSLRVVQVIREKGWEFYSEGKILPFENPDYYEDPKVANRLNPNIVTRYLESIGWNLESDAFWQSNDDAWVASKAKFK